MPLELSPLLERFAERSPLPVLVRALLERCLNPQQLDAWFARVAEAQYTRHLLFSTARRTVLYLIGTAPVPPEVADAATLATLYRERWTVEKAFLHLSRELRCEFDTLAHPPAALFAFACAVLTCNILAVTTRSDLMSPTSRTAFFSSPSSGRSAECIGCHIIMFLKNLD